MRNDGMNWTELENMRFLYVFCLHGVMIAHQRAGTGCLHTAMMLLGQRFSDPYYIYIHIHHTKLYWVDIIRPPVELAE